MYGFRAALSKIRERTVFLGKEWMYTHALTSAQPQAATRYLLAAVAVLDDALEDHIDAKLGGAPRDVTSLGKRIEFLDQGKHLKDGVRLKAIQKLRNVYAHEADKDSNPDEALVVIADIEAELKHLGVL
jgi:hypothetical protein